MCVRVYLCVCICVVSTHIYGNEVKHGLVGRIIDFKILILPHSSVTPGKLTSPNLLEEQI